MDSLNNSQDGAVRPQDDQHVSDLPLSNNQQDDLPSQVEELLKRECALFDAESTATPSPVSEHQRKEQALHEYEQKHADEESLYHELRGEHTKRHEHAEEKALQHGLEQKHRAGFVNIVGNPNVGKSTLMNDLVGERISIITSKAQTTRHRIMGIVNTDDYQIVFSDTPGVLKPKYKLQESMLDFSQSALTDADVLLYVTDVVEDPEKNADFLDRVAREKIPVLLVINKIDLLTGGQKELEALVERWHKRLPNAEIFPTSALEHFNVEHLRRRIVELLPVSPPFFGKDALTDKPARFFVTEIIREKILLDYDKEIPYSAEVLVEKFDESEKAIHIMAVIYVERDSQKGIIIGHKGDKIKKVGIQARQDIEKFFGKRVYLELFVKVEKDWRNRENKLRAFGYIE